MATQYLDPVSGAIVQNDAGGIEYLNPIGGIANETAAAATGGTPKQYLVAGVGIVNDPATDNEWLIAGSGIFNESAAAAAGTPATSVMNQLQGSNLGADLFNGTLL